MAVVNGFSRLFLCARVLIKIASSREKMEKISGCGKKSLTRAWETRLMQQILPRQERESIFLTLATG
jgi:hypothetical protein